MPLRKNVPMALVVRTCTECARRIPLGSRSDMRFCFARYRQRACRNRKKHDGGIGAGALREHLNAA